MYVEDEEWGPWQTRFPSIAGNSARKTGKTQNKTPRTRRGNNHLSTLSSPSHAIPLLKPTPVPSVPISFNATYALDRPVPIPKSTHLSTLLMSPNEYISPRSQSVTRGRKSPSLLTKKATLHKKHPISLTLHIGNDLVIGQKVLAGPLLPNLQGDSPVMDALERRLSRLMVKRHQHALSQG